MILIRGKSPCGICGLAIEEDDEIATVPPLAAEQNDPLSRLFGRFFHRRCYESSPAHEQLEAEVAQFARRRRLTACPVCQLPVTGTRDGVYTGRLGPAGTPADRYNYVWIHKKCLANYSSLGDLLEFIQLRLGDPTAPRKRLEELRTTLTGAGSAS